MLACSALVLVAGLVTETGDEEESDVVVVTGEVVSEVVVVVVGSLVTMSDVVPAVFWSA